MTQTDLPATAPDKTASEKPSALGGVHFERKKRKAAEARALAAEEAVVTLQGRVDGLEQSNRKLAEELRAAVAKATKAETLLKAEKDPHSLAALGLHLDRTTGTISGGPRPTSFSLADLPSLADLGKGS